MSLITIITDASFAIHDHTNAAGWAGFVAAPSGKRYFGDAMHVQPVNNINAEAFAVVNTLHQGIHAGMIQYGDYVIIQSDCIAAMQLLQKPYTYEELQIKKKQAGRVQANIAQQTFEDLVMLHSLRVEWRHVRGHTGHPDSRFIVQDKVDRKAKYHMAVQASERRALRNGTQG
jgi:ribonuclease HI